MSQLPNIRPSLLLDFANTRSLDPRVTFTRASGGTHFNAQGLLVTAGDNRPRFDHDPVTGQSLGLLVEESRVNLLLRSEEFNVSPWEAVNATVTANVTATIAPDGTTTADKLVDDTQNLTHSVRYTPTIADNTVYTLSVFAKAAERTNVVVTLVTKTSGVRAIGVNLTNGAIFTPTGISGLPLAGYGVTPVGNGWYRIWVANDVGSGVNGQNVRIFTSDGVGITYTGDGTSGIFIWGAQLELGAFPTSYIATTGATATRAADVASITGSNFSGWYRQDEGTMLCVAKAPAPVTGLNFSGASVSDGTTNNRMQIRLSNNGVNSQVLVFKNGTAEYISTVGDASSLLRSIVFGYKANDVAVSRDGGVSVGTSTASIPEVNKMLLGAVDSFGEYLNGHIRKLAYYPRRLSNTELQELTK
jgi:hypothetical protein